MLMFNWRTPRPSYSARAALSQNIKYRLQCRTPGCSTLGVMTFTVLTHTASAGPLSHSEAGRGLRHLEESKRQIQAAMSHFRPQLQASQEAISRRSGVFQSVENFRNSKEKAANERAHPGLCFCLLPAVAL